MHTTALNRRRLLVGGTAAIAAAGVAYTGWRRGWFTSAEVSPNSIAVLPFDNLSGDPAQDYFAEGLAEETRLALARNPLLKVIATTSSSMFRNSNESVLEIAAKLGVAIVLEGSVRRVDDLVRIAVKFIDGKTGASKWTQEFRGGFTDVFGLQDEVSGKVAESLTAQAGGEGMFTALTTAAESGATTSAPAFDALLKGRSEYSRAESAEGLQAAVGHFDAAIAIDGNYAAAHANRSKCLAELAGNFAELTDIPDLNREAIEAARRAVSLAPKYADGHSALAFSLLHGNLSLADARASFEQSRALGEGNASTMLEFARFSALDGKPEQAAQASTRALLLDPVNARAHAAHCRVLYSSRNYAAAVAAARQTLAINPQAAGVYGFMGRSLMLMGDRKAGLEASKQETLDWCLATDLAIMNFLNGDKPAAERAFESLAALEQTHYQQAEVLAQWGDSSGALLHLDQAFAQGDVGTVELATDPLLDPLRNHHAWRDYEQRIGFRA